MGGLVGEIMEQWMAKNLLHTRPKHVSKTTQNMPLTKQGITLLLVEQNVTKTLQVNNRGYVLEKGGDHLERRESRSRTKRSCQKSFSGSLGKERQKRYGESLDLMISL